MHRKLLRSIQITADTIYLINSICNNYTLLVPLVLNEVEWFFSEAILSFVYYIITALGMILSYYKIDFSMIL